MDEQKSNCEENDSEPTGNMIFLKFSQCPKVMYYECIIICSLQEDESYHIVPLLWKGNAYGWEQKAIFNFPSIDNVQRIS